MNINGKQEDGGMLCYECARQGLQREAVGLCTHCSAGLCIEHAKVVNTAVTADRPILRTMTLPLQARKLLCQVCKEALDQPRAEPMMRRV
jgi:hypothetical protein